jgi:hypothetical protein
MFEAGDQCFRVKWSKKVKDAQVEGDEKENFQGAPNEETLRQLT